MRAPLRGARTSARLATLADRLLASLAQFTRRQAPSAHRSRCSLIQRSQTGAICPSLALLAHSAQAHWRHLPIARVARSFSARTLAPSAHRSRCSLIQRSQTGAICPSLALLAHSAQAHWRHLPITRVDRTSSEQLAGTPPDQLSLFIYIEISSMILKKYHMKYRCKDEYRH